MIASIPSVKAPAPQLDAQQRLPHKPESLIAFDRVRKLRGLTEQALGSLQQPPEFTENRANRRDRSRLQSKLIRHATALMKATAWVVTFAMLHATFAPHLPTAATLFAQPNFQDFEERSQKDADKYVDRARRLGDADAWTNYVELGVASEFIEWEEEALEQVRDSFRNIDEDESLNEDQKTFEKDLVRAQYEAAAAGWEVDASEYVIAARAEYRVESASLSVQEITEAEYAEIIADADAAVAADFELSLTDWDATIALGRNTLEQRFNDSLTATLDDVRAANAGLTGQELALFEDALSAQEAELRTEFTLRDHWYVQQARNLYIAEKRADDVSLRLASDKDSADAVGDQVIDATIDALNAETTEALEEAQAGLENLLNGADFDEGQFDGFTTDWERQMEAVVTAGLHKWDRAEEDLYQRRVAWIEENKRSRAEGEEIWQRNHTKIKEAREKWLSELQEMIQEGYELWDEKFAEFAESRTAAEAELNQFIADERERRAATLAQVGDMVRGGGAALGEAKDAYYYYSALIAELPAPPLGCTAPANRDEQLYCFYSAQRDIMQASIGRFQTILAGVDTALDANMHSGENHTGFLRDVRLFARTLPDDIAALDAGDFKNELRADMQARGEEYMLYRADLYELSDANAVFVRDAAEMLSGQPFDYNGAADVAALIDLVTNLDPKYGDHRRELLRIIGKNRDGLPDDAAILAAIKTDIADWATVSVDENVRLRKETLGYFDAGAAGYYLSGNENDPYLMTQAEFEWELLRRERDYLAKRMRRAAEVKRYAELAEAHDAGLEMAQVTIERADITKIRSDIRELEYLLIKGDLNVDPQAVTDTVVRDAAYELALSERGIDPGFLDAREAALDAELAVLNDAFGNGGPDVADLDALIADLDTILTAVSEQLPAAATDAERQTARDTHRMGVVRAKLLKYRAELVAGTTSAQTLTDRWTALNAGFGALRDEINALKTEYDFDGLRTELAELRVAFGEQSLQSMQGDLRLIRDDLEANAAELAVARQRLEDAKTLYRDARIDFDILNAGNSEELIRIDINNTTGELAGVLNRMAEIEDIPEMAGRLFDPVTARRAEYLFEVSENARAKNDIAYTDQIYLDVQGLEEAKERAATLETVLATVAGETDPLALADAFLDRKDNLLETTALQEELKSLGPAKVAFDDLQLARDTYDTAKTALDTAIAAVPADDADIAVKTAELEAARFKILQAIELMVPAIRGEERARREIVLHLLGTGGTDPETLYEQVADDEQDFADRGYDLSEAAGAALRQFLETNRGKSFTELLELINTQIAAANRELRTDAQGYGLETAGGSHSAYERLVIVRDWVVRFRPDIDYVNSPPEDTPFDRRSSDEKWESLLSNARDTEEDSAFYRNFATGIPSSAGDAWVVNYENERTALRDRLTAALAVPDAGLNASYAALSADDRNLLLSYGNVIDQATPADLRASLVRVRRAINLDLMQLDTGFREVYLRETAIDNQRVLDGEGRTYNQIQQRLGAVRSERSQLQRDLDDLDAAILAETDPAARAILEDRRDDVADRVSVLDSRMTALETQAEPLRDRLRQATNVLREIKEPGSSALLAAHVRQLISGERLGIDLKGWAADSVLRKRQVHESDVENLQAKLAARDYGATTEERLKAILGFYQTDSANVILRDDSDVPLVSQEFIDLGITDPNADLLSVLGGSQTGPNLERWSKRLIAVLEDPKRSAELAPEVGAAARQLEIALSNLAAARSFIENRNTPADALLTQSIAERTRLNELSKKISLLRQFEDGLRQTAADAQANELDVTEALLGQLEKSENAFVFRLFQGYDENGVSDGIADAELDARVQQLRTLYERLRAIRNDQAVSQVADAYAGALEAHLVDHAVDPIAAGTGPEADAFFDNYDFLKATAIESGVAAIAGDSDFRANLWDYLATLAPEARLYKSAIVSVLHTSTGEGADLKTAVVAAIDQLEIELEDGLTALTGEAGRRMVRDRDLDVETSVADLIAAHAAANPALSAPELQQLADELYIRELNHAIAVSDSADAYDPDDYPEELREFVLVRQYRRAVERMDAYRAARASDVATIRDTATLDLRGISGDVARSVLADDFDDYLAANDTPAFLADGEGGSRSVAEFVNAYYNERQTGGELLPEGGLLLYERAALKEYQRMQADATTAGGLAKLDESEYLADFQAFIILAMVDDYMTANALSLVGATREDRKANFQADFEALLDDPAYANGAGQTLRQRLLASSAIDAVFQLSFAYLEEAPGHDAYLPGFLEERRVAGTLDGPQTVPESYLPTELLAIAGYQSADYRAILVGVNTAAGSTPQAYAAEFARLETAGEFQAQLAEGRIVADYQRALYASDTELDAIIAAAGYASVDAATRTMLRTQLKAQYQAAYLQTNGLDLSQGGVDYTQSVALIVRQDLALRELLPGVADRESLEGFFRREGPRFDIIEAKFFEELQQSDGRLREAAKENRGEFIRAVIERSEGTSTAYYNGLAPEVQTALDAFQNRLFAGGTLSAEEQAAARTEKTEYEKAFALRSSQELVASGIFENLDQILMSGVLRATEAGSALESAVREQRSEYLKALIEEIQVQNGTRANLSAESAALLAATPDAATEITRMAADMDPEFAKLIEREDLLVNRFVSQLRERDDERRELMRIVNDPALLNPAAKLNLRAESARALEQSVIRSTEAGAALLATIQDHDRVFAETQREYQRGVEAAGKLEEFARKRGDEPLASRFSSYRTYIGSERGAQQTAYEKYRENHIASGSTDPLLSFEDYHGGQILEADSLGLDARYVFDSLNWEDQLISDDVSAGQSIELGTTTAVTTDDQTIETRRVRRVSDPAQRESFGNDYNAELAYTYNEHLANNYLEAVSELNAALNSVFLGAKLADRRLANDPQKNLRDELAGKYDANAAAGVNDLDDILAAKQNAQSRLANHDDGRLQTKRQAVDSTQGGFKEAAEAFADASRRGQVRTMNLVSYLETVYYDVAEEMDLAQTEVTDLSEAGEQLQQNYAGGNQIYVNRLNDMAAAYRGFQQANAEYETALAVKEYAETPYLFAATTNVDVDLDQYSADARGEYEIAVAALENANERMRQAAFNVETQDQLANFNRIVEGLEANTAYPPLSDTERERLVELQSQKHGENATLDAAEEAELDTLVLREMYERYGDLIAARADHIKHSMRMVRIHKANEIVNAEIERLRGVVAEKKKKFDQELDKRFGRYTDPEEIEARNTVYMRLAGKVQAGETNFYQEFRGWYWGMGQWAGPYADAATSAAMNGGSLQITPTQISEAQQGLAIGSFIPPDEREAIGKWLATNPPYTEFNAFRGSYFNQLTISGQADMALVEKLVTDVMAAVQIALGTTLVVLGTTLTAGAAIALATGAGFLASGMALLAGILTAPAAPVPLSFAAAFTTVGLATMATGISLIAGGVTMIAAGIAQMAAATAKLALLKQMQLLQLGNSLNLSGTDSVNRVMAKQGEYEAAQAELDYFTKIPDMQTMKDRMIQFGAYRTDNDSPENLYRLTDEDLKYMFDTRSGSAEYKDSQGTDIALSAQEENDAYDATDLTADVKFRDSFNRLYDPTTLTDTQPGPLNSGEYGDGWTRVQTVDHTGAKRYQFAKIIPDGAANEEFATYNMGDVFGSLVAHGQQIRDERRDAYLVAGNNVSGEQRFVLKERDNTFDQLFEDAAGHVEGGNEYTGYRMVYEEYEANQNAVFEAELNQRVQVQLKEWQLREQELNDRFESWKTRMNAIVAKGREQWGNSENRFLQQWREWERQRDADEAQAKADWDAATRTHMQNRQDWEQQIRAKVGKETAREVLTGAIDDLNAQIRISSNSLGLNLEQINRNAKINEVIDEINKDLPSSTEKLADLNASIKSFNTTLALSELAGTNTGIGTLGAEYREGMRKHVTNMKTQAKVKMYEQYRRLVDGFKLQIEDQNEAIENQTRAAALAEGYVQVGSRFVKASTQVKTWGAVDSYVYFDTETEVNRAMAAIGFNTLEGDALFDFLVKKSEVEVDSFFYTQKLAAQSVFEKILGKAKTEEERETGMATKNREVIGQFAYWVGAAPDEQAQQRTQQATQAAGNSFGSDVGARNVFLQTQFGSGFGELGTGEQRISGPALGFYLQLGIFNDLIQQDRARNGLIQSMQKNRNDMIREQGTNLAKTFTKTVAQSVAAGAAVIGGPIGFAVAVGAAATIYAADSTHVDSNTGKVTVKGTEQAALAFATTVAGAATGSVLLNTAINTTGSAAQYNEKGQITGFNYQTGASGAALGRSVAGSIGGGAGKAIGGLGGVAAQTAINLAAERAIEVNLGHQYANYQGVATSALQGTLAETTGANATLAAERAKQEAAERARQKNNTHQTAGIFQGIGAFLRREWNEVSGIGSTIAKAAGLVARGFGWESADNYVNGRGYRDDATVKKENAEIKKAYLRMLRESDGVGVFKDLAQQMAKSRLFTKKEIIDEINKHTNQRQAEHNAAYKETLWKSSLSKADQYKAMMQAFGYNTKYADSLRDYVVGFAKDKRDRQRMQLQLVREKVGTLSDAQSRWYDFMLPGGLGRMAVMAERREEYNQKVAAALGGNKELIKRFHAGDGSRPEDYETQAFRDGASFRQAQLKADDATKWIFWRNFTDEQKQHMGGGFMLKRLEWDKRHKASSSYRVAYEKAIAQNLPPHLRERYFKEYLPAVERAEAANRNRGATDGFKEWGESWKTIGHTIAAGVEWSFNDKNWSDTFNSWNSGVQKDQAERQAKFAQDRMSSLDGSAAGLGSFYGMGDAYGAGKFNAQVASFVIETAATFGVAKIGSMALKGVAWGGRALAGTRAGMAATSYLSRIGSAARATRAFGMASRVAMPVINGGRAIASGVSTSVAWTRNLAAAGWRATGGRVVSAARNGLRSAWNATGGRIANGIRNGWNSLKRRLGFADEVERGMTGLRQNPARVLDADDIARLEREFAEVGGDPSMLHFNTGRRTGYVDDLDIIRVRGDVLPLDSPNIIHPRSTMSSRATLAHERGHQAYRGTRLTPGSWNDEFRASYWAAKNAPGLSTAERVDLLQDAILRAQEAGIPIRMNSFMRKTLYGF